MYLLDSMKTAVILPLYKNVADSSIPAMHNIGAKDQYLRYSKDLG